MSLQLEYGQTYWAVFCLRVVELLELPQFHLGLCQSMGLKSSVFLLLHWRLALTLLFPVVKRKEIIVHHLNSSPYDLWSTAPQFTRVFVICNSAYSRRLFLTFSLFYSNSVKEKIIISMQTLGKILFLFIFKLMSNDDDELVLGDLL